MSFESKTLLVAPTEEPVSREEAKLWLRIYDDSQDSLVDSLIVAARQHVENYTRRALITQQWRFYQDRFPIWPITAPMDSYRFSLRPTWIVPRQDMLELHIPYSPVQSVQKLAYLEDPNGDEVVVTDYQLDTGIEPARIVPAYGTYWPIARWAQNSIILEVTCGYGGNQMVGSPAVQTWVGQPIPGPIKAAMCLMMTYLNEHRGDDDAKMPQAIADLLAPYRVYGMVS